METSWAYEASRTMPRDFDLDWPKVTRISAVFVMAQIQNCRGERFISHAFKWKEAVLRRTNVSMLFQETTCIALQRLCIRGLRRRKTLVSGRCVHGSRLAARWDDSVVMRASLMERHDSPQHISRQYALPSSTSTLCTYFQTHVTFWTVVRYTTLRAHRCALVGYSGSCNRAMTSRSQGRLSYRYRTLLNWQVDVGFEYCHFLFCALF